jgi:hypothetical protein
MVIFNNLLLAIDRYICRQISKAFSASIIPDVLAFIVSSHIMPIFLSLSTPARFMLVMLRESPELDEIPGWGAGGSGGEEAIRATSVGIYSHIRATWLVLGVCPAQGEQPCKSSSYMVDNFVKYGYMSNSAGKGFVLAEDTLYRERNHGI